MSTDVTMEPVESSGGRSVLRAVGFGILFLVCLISFTLVKVPQSKIHAWILGTLNQQLGPMGIQASAESGHIEIGFGLRYEMNDIRLTMVDTQKVLRFDRLEVAPNIIAPLLQGKIGAYFRLEQGAGSITGNLKKQASGDDIDADVQIVALDFGKMSVLPFAVGLNGGFIMDGSMTVSGSATSLVSLAGKVNLTLKKIVIDAQKFKGFDIPQTSIADGAFDIDLGGGKATINTARLGKAGGNDDLQGSATGDVKLNKVIDSSETNFHVKFGFSDHYRQEKTISLLDSLLGMFKKPDGSFAMRFSGPMYAAQPSPDP
jgi:type II secretion system protein N